MDIDKFWKQDKETIKKLLHKNHAIRRPGHESAWNMKSIIEAIPDPDAPPKLEVGDLVKWVDCKGWISSRMTWVKDKTSVAHKNIYEVWREVEPSFYFTELELSNPNGAGSMMFGKDEIKIFKRIYKRAYKSAGGE